MPTKEPDAYIEVAASTQAGAEAIERRARELFPDQPEATNPHPFDHKVNDMPHVHVRVELWGSLGALPSWLDAIDEVQQKIEGEYFVTVKLQPGVKYSRFGHELSELRRIVTKPRRNP